MTINEIIKQSHELLREYPGRKFTIHPDTLRAMIETIEKQREKLLRLEHEMAASITDLNTALATLSTDLATLATAITTLQTFLTANPPGTSPDLTTQVNAVNSAASQVAANAASLATLATAAPVVPPANPA